MEENNSYFKFMSDVIESETWAKLSAAAKALYPVLLKFSNGQFKPVWPGTETLLRLTGFKSKKSLQSARRELATSGLIDFIPGTGRTSTRYYFKFTYPGSRVERSTSPPPRGVSVSTPGGNSESRAGGAEVPANYINIQIHQSENKKQTKLLKSLNKKIENFLKNDREEDPKNRFIESLLEKYGELEVGEAINIAIRRGKSGDIKYLEGILRNRDAQGIKINQRSPERVPEQLRALFPPDLQEVLAKALYRYTYNGKKYYLLPEDEKH